MKRLESGRYAKRHGNRLYYVTKCYFVGGCRWELSVFDENEHIQYEPELYKTKKQAIAKIAELTAKQ